MEALEFQIRVAAKYTGIPLKDLTLKENHREGHKAVHMINAFLLQKLMIRRIAADNGSPGKKLTNGGAPLRVGIL